jgi:BirA family biotin operon repressor/biotin-[acetyl-CoA-carboxylase] ligase
VFAGSRKLAGILVDVLSGGRHVIGIGLNVNNSLADAPPEVAARAVSLCELAHKTLDRTSVLCDVLRQLKASLQAAAADPLDFGKRFQSLCLQVGQPLTLDVAGRFTTGRCAGIAADGALLLETDRGLERHYSGSLVHSAAGN